MQGDFGLGERLRVHGLHGVSVNRSTTPTAIICCRSRFAAGRMAVIRLLRGISFGLDAWMRRYMVAQADLSRQS